MSKSDPGQDTGACDYFRIFRDLPESYVLFEAAEPYRVVEVNRAREKLTGVSRKAALGRPVFEVYPDTTEKFKRTGVSEVEEAIRKAIRTGKPVTLSSFRYNLVHIHLKREAYYWHSTYVPLKFDGQKVTHVLAATRDVTAEHETERQAVITQERLEAALNIGKVGSWVWDVERNVTVGGKNLAKILHTSYKQVAAGAPMEDFLQFVHPKDRARIDRAMQRSVRDRVKFDEEYRLVLPNGKERWVLARGKAEEVEGRMLFSGVLVDITERRDLQAQVELARQQDKLNRQAAKILQQRNDELEAIATTKDEFVALASHQLRTPATAVKQYIGMVLQGYVGEVTEVQKEMLEKAFESNERQIQIINQILNAARVDTGRLIMTPVPLDLRSLVQGIATDMQSDFEAHQHTFTLKLPKQPVPIVADLGYLRMAIENILHNAVVYTPQGGNVTVELVKVGKQAQLKITDDGVGIKKSDLSKLFAKFSRLHNPLSVQAGGSGIGLYLAAEIIRLHSGAVTVESKVNKGSTFAICLPLVQNTTRAP